MEGPTISAAEDQAGPQRCTGEPGSIMIATFERLDRFGQPVGSSKDHGHLLPTDMFVMARRQRGKRDCYHITLIGPLGSHLGCWSGGVKGKQAKPS